MAGIIISVLAVLFLTATVLPLVRNDYWTFRSLEYPRLQKLVIGIVLLIATFIFRSSFQDYFLWVVLPLVTACIYLCIKIYPYTWLAPKEMKAARIINENDELKVITANVLEDNEQYHRLVSLIKSIEPHLVLLVETDHKWEKAMKDLDNYYPFSLKKPIDNTYGLLFYSKLKLRNEKILFRVEDDVPSIEAEAMLPSGKWIKVYGLHPKPPVPDESLTSTAKDKELMKIALLAKEEKHPCIVMGDLNDVAWSHVTTLFRKVSGLLDPRRGRGFFSTYSAFHWWFRFPLDYIFCSKHFGWVEMKRLPPFGSDHFAMYIKLQYEPGEDHADKVPHADEEEKSEAQEKASQPVK